MKRAESMGDLLQHIRNADGEAGLMQDDGNAQRCPLCGGHIKRGTTTFTAEPGFGVVVIRNVPARVCHQCGEAWIEDGVAADLERHVNEAREQRQQIAAFAMN